VLRAYAFSDIQNNIIFAHQKMIALSNHLHLRAIIHQSKRKCSFPAAGSSWGNDEIWEIHKLIVIPSRL
jgi:hypothetical protein